MNTLLITIQEWQSCRHSLHRKPVQQNCLAKVQASWSFDGRTLVDYSGKTFLRSPLFSDVLVFFILPLEFHPGRIPCNFYIPCCTEWSWNYPRSLFCPSSVHCLVKYTNRPFSDCLQGREEHFISRCLSLLLLAQQAGVYQDSVVEPQSFTRSKHSDANQSNPALEYQTYW